MILPREVEGERADDHQREEERDREAGEQRHPRVAQLRLRLGDDQVPEHRPAARPDRVRGGEKRPVLAGRAELEGDDSRRREVDADVRERDPGQAGVLARGEGRADEVEPVSGRRLELGRGEGGRGLLLVHRPHGRLGVQLREPPRLAAQLVQRGVARVVLEEAQRDQARDEPGERDSRQEERRQAKAQGVEHGSYAAGAGARSGPTL